MAKEDLKKLAIEVKKIGSEFVKNDLKARLAALVENHNRVLENSIDGVSQTASRVDLTKPWNEYDELRDLQMRFIEDVKTGELSAVLKAIGFCEALAG